jgi:hypothetical protein
MSFALTTKQFLDRSKTVTRRLGWANLKPGDIVNAVVKSQGLKKGEKVQRLGQIRIISVTNERLDAMADGECALEGFPDVSKEEFIDFFCAANQCPPMAKVNRIEFERLD